jgi:hypothetical protein
MSVFVSRGDSQRVLFCPVNAMTAGSLNTRFHQLVESHNCSNKTQTSFHTLPSHVLCCGARYKGYASLMSVTLQQLKYLNLTVSVLSKTKLLSQFKHLNTFQKIILLVH